MLITVSTRSWSTSGTNSRKGDIKVALGLRSVPLAVYVFVPARAGPDTSGYPTGMPRRWSTRHFGPPTGAADGLSRPPGSHPWAIGSDTVRTRPVRLVRLGSTTRYRSCRVTVCPRRRSRLSGGADVFTPSRRRHAPGRCPSGCAAPQEGALLVSARTYRVPRYVPTHLQGHLPEQGGKPAARVAGDLAVREPGGWPRWVRRHPGRCPAGSATNQEGAPVGSQRPSGAPS
jgi:hypothetical protein